MHNDLIGRAVQLAASAHRHQTRKGCDTPYIVHPFEVSRVLREHGLDESHETLHVAALLHDVVEDTDVTLEDLRVSFPGEVADWVDFASEVKRDCHGHKLDWKTRKMEHLARLAEAPWQVSAIVLADKIHNLRDIVSEPRDAAYWEIFSAPKSELLWYYRETLNVSQRGERTRVLVETARHLVAQFEQCLMHH